MDGPHIDRQIAELSDNQPAAEQGPPIDARVGDRHSWLEISEVGFSDGTVVEVLHGSPDLVAAAAWAGPRMADLDVRDGDTVDDHQVAQVAALHHCFAAARDDAVSRLAGDNARGEDHSTAGEEASARREHRHDASTGTTRAQARREHRHDASTGTTAAMTRRTPASAHDLPARTEEDARP